MANRMMIKSFKHNGSVHRIWKQNWLVPDDQVMPEHRAEGMRVLVSSHTPIVEASGKQWISRVPGVSFFIPDQWYNIVALIEAQGIRYYCNVASPPYLNGDVLTYIDYDLDVIVLPNRTRQIVDVDEYEFHQMLYHYSSTVKKKVERGLEELLVRIDQNKPPFHDEAVYAYYELWRMNNQEVRGESDQNE